MLAGDIHLTFDSISTSIPHIRSGRLHALAVTSKQRSAPPPEVPTLQEQGLPGLEVNGWYALIAPAQLPANVAQLRAQMICAGYEPAGSTPQALQAHIDQEINRWAQVVKATGARID